MPPDLLAYRGTTSIGSSIETVRDAATNSGVPDTKNELHDFGLSGYVGRNWGSFHAHCVDFWDSRVNFVVTTPPADTYHPSLDYLRWYTYHTVRYIQQPSYQEGYRGDAGQYVYMIDALSRISHTATGYGAGVDNPSQTSQFGFSSIRDESFGTMHYLQQGLRIPVGPIDCHGAGSSTSQDIPY